MTLLDLEKEFRTGRSIEPIYPGLVYVSSCSNARSVDDP